MALGMQWMKDVPVLHLENRLADFRMALRIEIGQLTADHRLDNTVFAYLRRRGVERVDRPAIAQDSDAVGDFHHLVELVGDED